MTLKIDINSTVPYAQLIGADGSTRFDTRDGIFHPLAQYNGIVILPARGQGYAREVWDVGEMKGDFLIPYIKVTGRTAFGSTPAAQNISNLWYGGDAIRAGTGRWINAAGSVVLNNQVGPSHANSAIIRTLSIIQVAGRVRLQEEHYLPYLGSNGGVPEIEVQYKVIVGKFN